MRGTDSVRSILILWGKKIKSDCVNTRHKATEERFRPWRTSSTRRPPRLARGRCVCGPTGPSPSSGPGPSSRRAYRSQLQFRPLLRPRIRHRHRPPRPHPRHLIVILLLLLPLLLPHHHHQQNFFFHRSVEVWLGFFDASWHLTCVALRYCCLLLLRGY